MVDFRIGDKVTLTDWEKSIFSPHNKFISATVLDNNTFNSRGKTYISRIDIVYEDNMGIQRRISTDWTIADIKLIPNQVQEISKTIRW